MTPNRTNHPPRKGIEVTPHKGDESGGRTDRLNARFTKKEKAAIMAAAHAAGLSVSDFIMFLMAQAQPTSFAADTRHAQAGANQSDNQGQA